MHCLRTALNQGRNGKEWMLEGGHKKGAKVSHQDRLFKEVSAFFPTLQPIALVLSVSRPKPMGFEK